MKIDRDEFCRICNEKLELRMIARERYIFYCHKCLQHYIIETSKKGDGKNEDRDHIGRSS